MSARAMWKGVLAFEDVRLPVKLYSAVQDRTVRFRLLHEEDGVPLRQRMINPETGETVEHGEARRGIEVESGTFVLLEPDEMDVLEPEPSRDIRILRFVSPAAVEHQWYDRPYYLGPDGSAAEWAAFARALENRGRVGIARWVMRKKRYVGAVQAWDGRLVLMTLRHAGEVITADELDAPEGRKLEQRERTMAEKFIGALEDEFDPEDYEDRYRERVMELIEIRKRGGSIEVPEYEEKRAPEELADLLERSLAQVS